MKGGLAWGCRPLGRKLKGMAVLLFLHAGALRFNVSTAAMPPPDPEKKNFTAEPVHHEFTGLAQRNFTLS